MAETEISAENRYRNCFGRTLRSGPKQSIETLLYFILDMVTSMKVVLDKLMKFAKTICLVV